MEYWRLFLSMELPDTRTGRKVDVGWWGRRLGCITGWSWSPLSVLGTRQIWQSKDILVATSRYSHSLAFLSVFFALA